MQETGPIINKVAQSGLITLNLENYLPSAESLVLIDVKQYLFKELILKEKDFRTELKATDWSAYESKYVGIYCSSDAIVPYWAYMLLVSYLQPVVKDVVFGDLETLKLILLRQAFEEEDFQKYEGERIVVKGCGDNNNIPPAAYAEITRKLRPYARSIMYGEPCSTVPVFKKAIKRPVK